MKIIVKSFFCPNYDLFCISSNSLNELIKYIDRYSHNKHNNRNSSHKFLILLVGFCSERFQKILKKQLQQNYNNHYKNNTKIVNLLKNTNRGKIKYIQDAIKYIKYIKKNDNKIDGKSCVFYFDHDIRFDMEINYFIDNKIFQNKFLNKKIGIIAFNQKMDCRHQTDCVVGQTKTKKDIYSSDNPGSIALGGFVTIINRLYVMEDIIPQSIYGIDDYQICEKYINGDYTICLLKNQFILHPFEKINEYKLWKLKMAHLSYQTYFESETSQNDEKNKLCYNKSIEESANLWITQQK